MINSCRCSILVYDFCLFHSSSLNWASEASPTLGCSIEISRDIYIFVPWFVQTDQSDCSIRGVYISYTPPKRVYIFCLRSRPPISRYAAKKPKRFRSKVNKVIIGRNNKVNFTSKSYMTAGRISERILADKLLARVVVNSYC